MANDNSASSSPSVSQRGVSGVLRWLGKAVVTVSGLAVAGSLALLMGIGLALAVAYPNLPDVADLADYRPKLPLRVLTADGQLIGEFGEERRNLLTFKEIPEVMKHAVLAIEDSRFFEHSGVDYRGMLPGGVHDHHAGGPQRVSVGREKLHPQDLRGPADVQA
jgi:membrane carboxypeptidase/penicillin-binding protein